MSVEDDPIIWSGFYQAYTGLRFSIRKDECKVFVPNYKNIFHTKIPSLSGTEMGFKDEWSNKSFLVAGSTEHVNDVLLRNLWEYANNNILWDSFKETLSFKDIEVDEIALTDFVKDLDSFLVFHKLSKFGNIWWHKRVVSDMEGSDSRNINVYVPNISSSELTTGALEIIKFWSPDKHLNDEYKKYLNNPTFYNGFFTSDEFNTGGWFNIPDLTISTKPFEKAKIAQVLLNLNFTFDPRNFGQYYAIDSTLAARIKDVTSDSILDTTQVKTGQNDSIYTDSLMVHWVGGLVSTDNFQTLGDVGNYVQPDGCTNPEPTPTVKELSHLIAGQISLNPEFNPQHKDALGTIDPINWRSSEIDNNAHKIGVLNTDRAFGGANGTMDGGLVFGGIQNDGAPKVIQSVEIWDTNGFLKNIQTQASVPRCFHIQGGTGSKSLVALAGYSRFNTDDVKQFGEYGKAGVRNDLEVFIKSDDPLLSYFKVVPTFKLNTQRGDFAGALSVETKDRQNKFDAVDSLKALKTGKDDEQRIAEFINIQSGSLDDTKRYSILTIEGIAFAGSSSGKSYMSTVGSTDILDSFEKINTVFVDVGVSNTSIAIAYSTVDSNLKYPVPCHGLRYVGNESAGLATGGRCEKSSISDAESKLIDKYTSGYNIDVNLNESVSSLEKSRVLDLVYEYNGITWTRKQNLLESVYYHCGVGDETHAIFWSGIHDSLAKFTFEISNETPATPQFNDWSCEDARKIISESIHLQGVSYEHALNSSACWTTPTWASISSSLLFDDPEYHQGSADLSLARDIDFPEINVLSLYPHTNKTFSAPQAYNGVVFNYPDSSSLDVTASYLSGADFFVEAKAISGAKAKVRGLWTIDTVINHFDHNHAIYPIDISGGISSESKDFQITSITRTGTDVNFNYNISHSFNYISTDTSSKSFSMGGSGKFIYDSLTNIWYNGIVPGQLVETVNNQMSITSTASVDPTATLDFTGTASLLITISGSNGVLIGVNTDRNTWNASFESCGSVGGIADYLNITTTLGSSGQTERWGVPLWTSAFDIPAAFKLDLGFNVYNEISDGNIGHIHHEISTISVSGNSLVSILNDRVLISGSTLEQDHSFKAMNSISFPSVTASCETLTNNVLSLTIPVTSDAGTAYTEYATSFIQEYRNDSRYKIPEIWIPSNGFNIRPENTGTLFKQSLWKRYMDGVGLGGDAPNYDTIFNSDTNKINAVGSWNQIGNWHVGQMAFGSPERAVIVGGHKINKNIAKAGSDGGLHAGKTTKRTFLWDFITIPEEDSYLTNYVGRRFYTVYSNNSQTVPVSSNNSQSDLNCIIFEAESPIIVERFGTATFDGTSDSVTVTFDRTMDDAVGTNYSISMTPSDNVSLWWSDKTTGGFTIKAELKDWKGKVDYLASAIIKVTEADIEEKGPTDAYIFDK